MSRVQLAINVADLEESVRFYEALFDTKPHKRREGYANFQVSNPPLKLVLIEVPETDRGTGAQGALNHLGVEVESTQDVQAQTDRLAAVGLAPVEQDQTNCCHAVQDKAWVSDPAGVPWEVYTITDDSPQAEAKGSEAGCCVPNAVGADLGLSAAESFRAPNSEATGGGGCC